MITAIKSLFGCKEAELKKDLEATTIASAKLSLELGNAYAMIEEMRETIGNLNKENVTLKDNFQGQLKTPTPTGQISYDDVEKVLKKYASGVNISDLSFSTTTQEDAKKFTNETRVWARRYAKEVNDCDNFSYALLGYWSDGLKSYPFGLAWSANHSFNVFIDDKKQLWIVEPQTNKWMKIEEAKSDKLYYPIRLVLM